MDGESKRGEIAETFPKVAKHSVDVGDEVFLGLLRTPARDAEGFVRYVLDLASDGLEPGERLRVVAGPVSVSGAIRRQRCLLSMSDNWLKLMDGKRWDRAVSIAREGLAVADPTRKGTDLRLPTGKEFRIYIPGEARENAQLGVLLNTFVLRGNDPRTHDRTTLTKAIFLGGHDLSCSPGATYELGFRSGGVSIRHPDGVRAAWLPLPEIRTFTVSGRGAYTTGGGFIGGGFGARGAVEGMVEAGILNSLTTRRHVDTVVCLRSGRATGYWEHGVLTPRQAQIELSWFEDALLTQEEMAETVVPVTEAPSLPEISVAEEISKLGTLLAKGLLSEEEFSGLKAALIRRYL